MKKVVISGISGFVGSALARRLARDWQVEGLSRSGHLDPALKSLGVSAVACDLFHYEETKNALVGADCAVYLVHSMLPRSRLIQASFQDLDFILADNFARAAQAAGVKQIVFLGGLIPSTEIKSAHLQSRLEVERVLGAYETPVTALRAGIILGAEGSSFHMVQLLVRRLKFMICPGWTQTPTQPVSLSAVVDAIGAVLGKEEFFNRSFDVGTTDSTTYLELMKASASLMGLTRFFIRVPFFSPALSRLWISLITGAPKNLVAPLIKSLKTPMVVQKDRRLAVMKQQTVSEALQEALIEKGSLPYAFKPSTKAPSGVKSIQRIQFRKEIPADDLTDIYFMWLDGFMNVIRVETKKPIVEIRLRFMKRPLLILEQLQKTKTYSSFKVIGGLLTYPNTKAVLDFRKSPLNFDVLTGLHDFEPRLPWALYAFTHAKLHAYAMNRFKLFLSSENS